VNTASCSMDVKRWCFPNKDRPFPHSDESEKTSNERYHRPKRDQLNHEVTILSRD
jgi:hypothetical protein